MLEYLHIIRMEATGYFCAVFLRSGAVLYVIAFNGFFLGVLVLVLVFTGNGRLLLAFFCTSLLIIRLAILWHHISPHEKHSHMLMPQYTEMIKADLCFIQH